MERCMADNTNSWVLQADGAWVRREPGTEAPRNAQDELRAQYAERAAEAQAAAS